MKLGIIGDVHLGASLLLGKKDLDTGINTRLIDYQDTLFLSMRTLRDAGAEVLILTGDIFESRNPTIKQMELFSRAIYSALQEFNYKKVYICVGNHDRQRSNNTHTLSYLQELKLNNVVVVDEITSFQVGGINLIFIPYLDRNSLSADSAEDAIKDIKKQINKEIKEKNIAIGHMMLEGTIPAHDYYADLYDSNELALPVSLFSKIQLTIMGHIHEPSVFSVKPRIIYSGSMDKRSHCEKADRTVLLVETDNLTAEQIPISCRAIHEIEYTAKSASDDITSEIIKHLDAQSFMPGSIVRINCEVFEDDVDRVSPGTIEQHLISRYKISHLLPVRPIPIVKESLRTVKISEQIEPGLALAKYIKANFSEHPYADEMLAKGKDFLS